MKKLLSVGLVTILLCLSLAGCVQSSGSQPSDAQKLKRIKELSDILTYQAELAASMQRILGMLGIMQTYVQNVADTPLWKDNMQQAASRLKVEIAKGKALVAPPEYKDQKAAFTQALDQFGVFADKMLAHVAAKADATLLDQFMMEGTEAVVKGAKFLNQSADLSDKISTAVKKEIDEVLKPK